MIFYKLFFLFINCRSKVLKKIIIYLKSLIQNFSKEEIQMFIEEWENIDID